MGSMDCLTTVIGTLYFGTVELNPLLADMVNTNLPLFVAVKLAITVCVGLLFVQAEKTLMKVKDRTAKSFIFTHKFLQLSYGGIVLFLVIVVTNNILVLVLAGTI